MEKLSEKLKLAEELREKGKYNEAVEIYLELKNDYHEELWINFIIGDIFYIMDDIDQATKWYEKCIENQYDDDKVILHLGHCIMDKEIRDSHHGALIEIYKEWLDPYFKNYGERKYNSIDVDLEEITSYDYECYIEAKDFIKCNLGM